MNITKKRVVAANHFRRAMLAQPEQTSLPTTLPDGKYIDKVHGATFRVKRGILTGTFAPVSSYALYAK